VDTPKGCSSGASMLDLRLAWLPVEKTHARILLKRQPYITSNSQAEYIYHL
jgi:hypothetical protein